MEENEVKEEVIPKELSSKVGQLQSAIAELAQYLETQSMDCYFNSLLAQLDKLSQDVNTRLEEVSTFYAFLVGSSPAATSLVKFSEYTFTIDIEYASSFQRGNNQRLLLAFARRVTSESPFISKRAGTLLRNHRKSALETTSRG